MDALDREARSQALADRLDLPRACARCAAPLRGSERGRLGLWNGAPGSICDRCDAEMAPLKGTIAYFARRRAVRFARHLGPTMRKRLRQEHLVGMATIEAARQLIDGTAPWPERNPVVRVRIQDGPVLWEDA